MARANVDIAAVDTSKSPDIYRTNNPAYFGRWCIDFQPNTVPTIASFGSAQEAVSWLVAKFGREQVIRWLEARRPLVVHGEQVVV